MKIRSLAEMQGIFILCFFKEVPLDNQVGLPDIYMTLKDKKYKEYYFLKLNYNNSCVFELGTRRFTFLQFQEFNDRNKKPIKD